MSFYSYIFKPGDFIKGYCFNISRMDECTHWWNTGKNEAHTAWNDHSLSFPNMFSNSVFYMQSKKQLGVFWAFWHNVFYSSMSEETERRMHAFKWQENGCWDFQLGGGEMRCYSQWMRRESWRRDKNVSIYANWCPDPPPGFHCLLSGEKIKEPSVLNRPQLRLCCIACGSFSFQVSRDSSEVLRGQPSRWCSFKTGSGFCLFKVSREMPDCAQPTSPPEQRGRSCGVQSASDDWWLWRESAVCCRSSIPFFARCEWAGARTEDGQNRGILIMLCRNISLKMFGAMLLTPKLTSASVWAKRNLLKRSVDVYKHTFLQQKKKFTVVLTL